MFFVWSYGISKQLKLSDVAYRRLKDYSEDILTKCSGPIDEYVKKAKKNRKGKCWERWWTSRKNKSYIENEIKTHFSWWGFDSDAQYFVLFLISLISTKHDLHSFYIFVSKFEGCKGQHFHGPPGRHSLTALLVCYHLTRFVLRSKYSPQLFRTPWPIWRATVPIYRVLVRPTESS